MIRYLIWDVDGTLFDTYPAIARAFGSALRDLGPTAPLERIAGLACVSVSHCARVLAAEYGLAPDDLLERFTGHYRAIPPQEQEPFPGVGAVCEYIRSLGGLNVIVTHRRRASLLQLLAVHDLGHHFADVITADDGYPRKPDPAAFLAVMDKHGFEPEATMAIGDREIDVLAGKAAGVRTCLLGTAAEGTVADHTISDLAGLHDVLVRESGRGSQRP